MSSIYKGKTKYAHSKSPIMVLDKTKDYTDTVPDVVGPDDTVLEVGCSEGGDKCQAFISLLIIYVVM